jgi:hypothetical protein
MHPLSNLKYRSQVVHGLHFPIHARNKSTELCQRLIRVCLRGGVLVDRNIHLRDGIPCLGSRSLGRKKEVLAVLQPSSVADALDIDLPSTDKESFCIEATAWLARFYSCRARNHLATNSGYSKSGLAPRLVVRRQASLLALPRHSGKLWIRTTTMRVYHTNSTF